MVEVVHDDWVEIKHPVPPPLGYVHNSKPALPEEVKDVETWLAHYRTKDVFDNITAGKALPVPIGTFYNNTPLVEAHDYENWEDDWLAPGGGPKMPLVGPPPEKLIDDSDKPASERTPGSNYV